MRVVLEERAVGLFPLKHSWGSVKKGTVGNPNSPQ